MWLNILHTFEPQDLKSPNKFLVRGWRASCTAVAHLFTAVFFPPPAAGDATSNQATIKPRNA